MPAHQLTYPWKEDYYVQGYALSRVGYTDKQIAGDFGVTHRQVKRWKKKYPAFKRAIEQGRHEYSESFGARFSSLDKRQRSYLTGYSVRGTHKGAEECSGHARQMHYKWMQTVDEYPEAFAIAEELAADALEQEARRRAIEGTKRFKFHQGLPIMIPCSKKDPEAVVVENEATGKRVYMKPYVEVEYSDRLLVTLLKGRRKDVFGDGPMVVNKNEQKVVALGDILDQAESATVIDGRFIEKATQAYLEDSNGHNGSEVGVLKGGGKGKKKSSD